MPDETHIRTPHHAEPTRVIPPIPSVASGPPPPGSPALGPAPTPWRTVALVGVAALLVGATAGWFGRGAVDGDIAPEQAAVDTSTTTIAPTTSVIAAADGASVAIDGPRRTTVGEAVTFTAQASGEPLTFDWDLNGEPRQGEVVTFEWDEAGPKTVRLTVGYANGTSTMETLVDVVEEEGAGDDGTAAADERSTTTRSEPSLLTADFRWSPEEPQPGQSISLIDESDGPIAQRRWNWRSSSIVSSSPQNVSTSFSEDTEVTLTVCLADGATCDSVTKLIEVG